MEVAEKKIKKFKAGTLTIEIYPDGATAGEAAARAAAHALVHLAQTLEEIGAIFATGASQLDTLRPLTSLSGVPWSKIVGFHLDEYVGLEVDHPASFRGYLRRNLTEKVAMKRFHEIDGTRPDLQALCTQYAASVKTIDPQLCLLGVGENGHLAFNDPAEADFNDPLAMKVVHLDDVCRQQQAAEGWFKILDDVPKLALTLTIPTLLRVPQLIVSVPGKRKATIIKRMLDEPISTTCPATILRTHPNAAVYLDMDSAALLL